MILQIRATSGGGKTTVMRHLMSVSGCVPHYTVPGRGGKSKALINKGDWQGYPFWVIGPYDNSATGGCDRISKIEEVVELVDKVARSSHSRTGKHKAIVCFEGLLLAHSWGQMGEHLHENYGDRYMNAFIDTSVEQCFENVLKRRAAGGADNSDEERIAKIKKNVVADHYRVELCHKRVIARGGQLIDVPYKTAPRFVEAYLNKWVKLQRSEK